MASEPVNEQALAFSALTNSFVVDFLVRAKVSTHVNQHLIFSLPVPRLTSEDWGYDELLRGVALLTCVGEEYRALWEEVYPGEPYPEPLSAEERLEWRAKMDATVAKIYGLTEEEFAYVLGTFPLAEREHKKKAMDFFVCES